jgi:hypothetical protein
VGELQSTLDALLGEDLFDLPAPALLERVGELVAAQNRLAAELARTVRRAELAQAPEHDGVKSMRSWLCGHARLSPAAAGQLVRNGRVLEQLPAIAAACTDGLVTGEQVSVIAPVTRAENLTRAAEQGIDLGAVEAVLTETAATRPHQDLGPVVRHYLSRLDPDGAEPDPTEQRSLSIAKHSDGSVTVRGELDAVGGEKFQAALESIVQANRPEGDLRSRAQQQGDALVQLCDNALASGSLPILRTVKPHVIVTIGIDDLVDPATAPARPRWASGRRSPPPEPAGSPATATSPAWSSGPRVGRWIWVAASGSCHHTCVGRSNSATATASSPAATPRPTGATSTIWSSG